MLAKAGPVAAVVVSTAAVGGSASPPRASASSATSRQGLPPLTLPPFDADLWAALLPAAVLISVIGFVESVSVAQTLAAKRRQRIDPDQELVGLGAANVAAALSGGFPVTGGFARSVVNFDAGAATPLAGVFTAAGIALTALFLTPLFFDLPKAVLAATIIVAVLSLVDLGRCGGPGLLQGRLRGDGGDHRRRARRRRRGRRGRRRRAFAGPLPVAHQPAAHGVVGQVPGTEHFRNVKRHAVVTSPNVLSVRVDESLYFANARFLEDHMLDFVAGGRR
jgi:sulfate permease, SulP family